MSIFDAGTWQNFTAADDPGLKSIRPLTSFAFRQNSTDEYWASSAGSGLLFFQKNRVSASYNEQNSSLGSSSGSCLVSGLALDQNNALWYTNPSGKVQLGTRTQGGNFVALPYPGMSFATYSAGDIISTTSGICWVAIPEEGLFAFRMKGTVENISDDQYRKIAVKSRFSNATTTLISSFTGISALAEDHNGQLWVGTNTGIVAYNNPDQVFEAGEFYGSQPSLANAESLFQPILEKEHVTSIAVDGGNRKWVGTLHSGAFLFTENGDHLLHHFDSANSPLPSDQINYIAILPQTGEVFFATDKGMVSYKNDATTGSTDFDKAYVWPNPLRETFEGGVTIDGLESGTEVRVTDVAGNLIFRTTSLGGRAVWNAKNARGTRVSTGVYLIFCASPQNKQSKIIKLLVIH